MFLIHVSYKNIIILKGVCIRVPRRKSCAYILIIIIMLSQACHFLFLRQLAECYNQRWPRRLLYITFHIRDNYSASCIRELRIRRMVTAGICFKFERTPCDSLSKYDCDVRSAFCSFRISSRTYTHRVHLHYRHHLP